MKTPFYCYQKSGFWERRKHEKQKHTPFPKHVFCVFCFQEQKTFLENKNQTDPKAVRFWFWKEEKFEKIKNKFKVHKLFYIQF